MKKITYSRNIFIPLTTACNNHCSYCNYRQEVKKAEIISLAEIDNLLRAAVQAGCKEVLFTSGSQPEKCPGFKEKLKNKTGFSSFVEFAITASQKALNLGLLPHSNLGVLSKKELKQLAKYNASLGLMLETTALVKAHRDSPTKEPKRRLKMIKEAGELKIPFTSGILLGIGEDKSDRVESLEQLRNLADQYGHLQEVIIQPVKTAEDANLKTPSQAELIQTIRLAKDILPKEIAIQTPPNLVELATAIKAGVDDLGGISPLTKDHINPEHNWPRIKELKAEFPQLDFQERLAVYPEFINKRWLADPVWNCLKEKGWLNEYSNY